MSAYEDPLAEHRRRECILPSDLSIHHPPRHIHRHDNDRRHVHGWQVHYTRPMRFFSDIRHGGPEKSLEAAEQELARVFRGDPAPRDWAV